MTQRERQILNWIEADPMISQQELAERAGITRSSVAVHISNLMKKGCIAGKGYIVTRSPYVTVVGGMNMDIGGWPSEELVAQDSNPGRVRMSPGGVGRNIAHNMSLMGLDVRLLTAFGDDVYAQKLAAVCGELGIDISQSPVIPGGHTSTYLFINDQQGDMQLAVSDMDIYRNLTPRVLAGRKQLLEGSQVVVIDTNLPAESIAWLADNCHAPIFADPVSTFRSSRRLRRSYIHGTTSSVMRVAYSRPPMHTSATGCIRAVPASPPKAMTSRPKIVVMDVMRMGRRRVTPASMMASRRPMPSRRSWLI